MAKFFYLAKPRKRKMNLCRLVYCSHAVPKLDYSDLKDILEKSQSNNAPLGITGMLSYGNSMFFTGTGRK